jgi:hypothetical protein
MGVVNVPAGSFDACMVYAGADHKSFTFFGNVPFGVIYYDNHSNNSAVVLQLHGFQTGQ